MGQNERCKSSLEAIAFANMNAMLREELVQAAHSRLIHAQHTRSTINQRFAELSALQQVLDEGHPN